MNSTCIGAAVVLPAMFWAAPLLAGVEQHDFAFEIPTSTVASALDAIARQSGTPVIFPYDRLLGMETRGLQGKYSLEEALALILEGTGLQAVVTVRGVITVNFPEKKLAADDANTMTKNSILSGLTGAKGMAQKLPFTQKPASTLEETVVTATRRAESVQDIPYNITAVSADSLENTGIDDIQDLFNFVPGFTHSDRGARGNLINSNFTLRGLEVADPRNTASFSNSTVPTVSTYLNDTPFFLNLQLADLARVEVLRGPQGTLYGSGSLGGTVRFIYNRPDTTNTSVSFKTHYERPSESDDQTIGIDTVLNIPFTNATAFRLSAGLKNVAGVYDANNLVVFDTTDAPVLADAGDPVGSTFTTRSKKDSDASESHYARGSLAADLSDDVSALLSVHVQHNEGVGEGFRTKVGSDFRHERYNLGSFEQDVALYSLELEARLGFATITSSTSHTDRDAESLGRDLTGVPLSFEQAFGCSYYGCFPRLTLLSDESIDNRSFTQELRMVSEGGASFSWVLGAFYSKSEDTFKVEQRVRGLLEWSVLPGSGEQHFNGTSGSTYADVVASTGGKLAPSDWIGGYSYFLERDNEFTDSAIFGELSYQLTPRLQTSFGFRFFRQSTGIETLQYYPPCGSACASSNVAGIVAEAGASLLVNDNKVSDSIFKLNLSYDLKESIMVYATWAEGFRHGGANAVPVGLLGITEESSVYEADETTNLEIGLKGTVSNNIRYSFALYNIDWDKPQVDTFLSFAGFQAVINGEEARSRGFEAELKVQLTTGLILNVGYAYTDAEITKDSLLLSSAPVMKGDPLSNVPDHNFTFATDYTRQFFKSYEILWHLDGNWKSEAEQNFNTANSRYLKVDDSFILNGAVALNSESWSLRLYAKNLTNEETVIAHDLRDGQNEELLQNIEWVTPPRTIGLSFEYRFD